MLQCSSFQEALGATAPYRVHLSVLVLRQLEPNFQAVLEAAQHSATDASKNASLPATTGGKQGGFHDPGKLQAEAHQTIAWSTSMGYLVPPIRVQVGGTCCQDATIRCFKANSQSVDPQMLALDPDCRQRKPRQSASWETLENMALGKAFVQIFWR